MSFINCLLNLWPIVSIQLNGIKYSPKKVKHKSGPFLILRTEWVPSDSNWDTNSTAAICPSNLYSEQ